MRRYCLSLLLLQAMSSPLVLAAEAVVITDRSEFEKFSLLERMSLFRDPSNAITAESLLATLAEKNLDPIAGNGVYFENKETYWLKFSLDSQASQALPLYLVGSTGETDRIELFELQNGRLELLARRGERIHSPEDNYRYSLFEMTVSPGPHTYFMRIQNSGIITLAYYLWTPHIFDKHVRMPEYLYLGILFGFLLVMMAYNTFLAIRLRDPNFMVYVCYIFAFCTVQFIYTGIARQFLGVSPVNFLSYKQVILIAAELTGAFGALFATLFLRLPEKAPRLYLALRLYYPLSLINIGLIIFDFPPPIGTIFITNTYVSVLLLTAAIHGCLQRYRPAYFYTAAWFFLIVGSLITMTRIAGLTPDTTLTSWSQFIGGAIEVVLLSLALGDKISFEQETSHKRISNLNDRIIAVNSALKIHIESVETIIEEQTRDIRSIMEHIPLGIFMIDRDGYIHKDHSLYLTKIMHSHQLNGQQATEILFTGSNLTTDVRSQVESCIITSLGENSLNFLANEHALPLELVRNGPGDEQKVFDLTWNTIENQDQEIDKILVTMRDVTEVRNLQKKSRDQQEELELISEINEIPNPRLVRFIQSCRQLIHENLRMAHSPGVKNRNFEILKLMFINMHTMKGSARSLSFKKMAAVFHDIEQYYALLQSNRSTVWDSTVISNDLLKAQHIVETYERVATDKLGRRIDQKHSVEFQIDQIKATYRQLKLAIRDQTLPQDLKLAIIAIQNLFYRKIFRPANDVMDEIFDCLPALAKELNKDIPETQVTAGGILLDEKAEDLFRNIFVHLLRNSMDHGIEKADERRRAGKNPEAHLSIELARKGDRLLLLYQDDGRGLDMAKLRAMGLSRGLLTQESAADPKALAELIFDSGLSTADQLTEISGRGVGMGAVRSFIEQNGGSIVVQFDNQQTVVAAFLPFAFKIDLPFNAMFDELEADLQAA